MNLVLQGPALEQGHVDEAARMTRASSAERIAPRAYRLANASQDKSLAAWCEAREIDHAFMPEGRRFADLKLLAMDMDSTLITVECIDELGELAGKKREIAAITAQAMRGEIDYTESLRRRVALLQGLEESALGRVYDERLRLTPGADRLLAACKRHRVQLLLVSGGFTFFTERLKARLDIDYTVSNVLGIERGRLTGRRSRGQGRQVPQRREGAEGPQGADRRPRRRRERPQDDGRGRRVDRVPRQAGGARSGELRAQLVRPGRRA